PSAEAPSTGDAGPTPEDLLERSAEPPTDSPEPVIDESVAATSPEPEPQEVAPEPPAPKAEVRKTPAPKPRAPEPAPERLVERSPKNFVPVQTVITQTIVAPPASNDAPATPKPSRAVSQHDPAAAAVRAAKSASLEAARTKLPAAFDKSGDAWERTLPLLETAPETLATARREWAQARFQAWAADPTPARRDAAIASARQYLLYAPPGPERDQAWTWLGRLKH
ncbi:MAG TPA: hypothetical protein VFU59_02595, partial [Candidatus Eisenbacteria bacterium]|nr:hypothetical protein [Candidatus Eisenbacteria bacterium]